MRRFALPAAALLLAPALAAAQTAPGRSAHDHAGHNHAARAHAATGAVCEECGAHGGEVTAVGHLRCETVLGVGGVQFWLTDAEGRPVPARGVRGAVSLQVAGNPKSYRYDLYPAAGANAPSNLLALPLDLSEAAGQEVAVAARLSGVPGVGSNVTTVRGAATIGAPQAAPLTAGTPVRATDGDAALIAAQKDCPVMDEPLGSMGVPWKIPVGDRAVFVCCKGCIKKVVAEPAKYVAMLPPPPATRATDADAAAIAAQATCPVMDEPLGSMGVPWKVPVAGGTVFVCCKGCIKRVHAEPMKYLAATQTGDTARN
ncbi:hypothetical protein [Alienimonas californiensis]|uniref:Archaeal TRASH domain protein n=1 Tax=Alienimonas californiensis TaxID=2527989 RepID=A0A517PB54_9PLAN|nr:hypothetical protein [Alienimonas californiensis]QDT16599.1 hypothetical protein CA12_27050 [Alienimonas californiensis]